MPKPMALGVCPDKQAIVLALFLKRLNLTPKFSSPTIRWDVATLCRLAASFLRKIVTFLWHLPPLVMAPKRDGTLSSALWPPPLLLLYFG